MKLLYKSRLVDIQGFHEVIVEGAQLTVTYSVPDSGILPKPDVFNFDYPGTALMVLRHIDRYCDTDRIVEIFESPNGKFTVTPHHDHSPQK